MSRYRRSAAVAARVVALVLAGSGCASVAPVAHGVLDAPVAGVTAYSLRLIGRRALERGLVFGATVVGGLSGIDYDPAADLFYLISDDRSIDAPTRFYTARLRIDEQRFHDIALQKVVFLEQPAGGPYPPGAADAEAIRFDPITHDLWWSSEGGRERTVRDRRSTTIRTDPFVRRSTVDGRYVSTLPSDPMFRFEPGRRGPRDNATFEGIALSPDGRSLWIAMEWPLLQDGPVPTMRDGAWSRISRHDRVLDEDAARDFGPLQRQFAYRIDPIPDDAWIARHAQNGISEILAIDDTRLLVLERAFAIGSGWRIRLFEADAAGASDIRRIESLQAEPTFVPMTKRLLLDFDALHIAIDNLEGLCFGPTLANGHRTLVVVSDDNFNPGEVTQFIAFEIVPR